MIGDQKKKKKKKQHLQGIRSTSLHPVLTPNLKNEHVLSFFPHSVCSPHLTCRQTEDTSTEQIGLSAVLDQLEATPWQGF